MGEGNRRDSLASEPQRPQDRCGNGVGTSVMDGAPASAQYQLVRPSLAASLLALLTVCAHAQPAEEDARLRAAQLAALAGICAYVQPGDDLSPMCGLGPERARAPQERLAVALAEAAALPPEARERARAEAMARFRAEQATHRPPKPTPMPTAMPMPTLTPTDRERVLIAPPGFGPDPTAPRL